jgi:hypothetical protein
MDYQFSSMLFALQPMFGALRRPLNYTTVAAVLYQDNLFIIQRSHQQPGLRKT